MQIYFRVKLKLVNEYHDYCMAKSGTQMTDMPINADLCRVEETLVRFIDSDK